MNDSGNSPIKVLIVDDSPFVRKALARIMDSADDIEVVACAASSEEALAALEARHPDVVTLDVLMPGADGLETLRQIMTRRPVPVVMVSALTTSDAPASVEALSMGAIDVVAKPMLYPNMNIPAIGEELLGKVRMAAGVDASRLTKVTDNGLAQGARHTSAGPQYPAAAAADSVVVVGCSTGGPPALVTLLSSLPTDFPFPLLIVQHMPRRFTAALAKRLDGLCALEVKEAADGDLIRRGRVLVARAGEQMHVVMAPDGSRIVRLDRRPHDTAHLPSVDVTMSDAASTYGPGSIAVLLTGMGTDGAAGMQAVEAAGGTTIAESERTAVVWGMPRAAIEAGNASRVLDLGDVAQSLCELAFSAANDDQTMKG